MNFHREVLPNFPIIRTEFIQLENPAEIDQAHTIGNFDESTAIPEVEVNTTHAQFETANSMESSAEIIRNSTMSPAEPEGATNAVNATAQNEIPSSALLFLPSLDSEAALTTEMATTISSTASIETENSEQVPRNVVIASANISFQWTTQEPEVAKTVLRSSSPEPAVTASLSSEEPEVLKNEMHTVSSAENTEAGSRLVWTVMEGSGAEGSGLEGSGLDAAESGASPMNNEIADPMVTIPLENDLFDQSGDFGGYSVTDFEIEEKAEPGRIFGLNGHGRNGNGFDGDEGEIITIWLDLKTGMYKMKTQKYLSIVLVRS